MAIFIQLFIISVSLSLDALSVSVAQGIKTQKAKLYDAIKIATFFGIFQAGMPLIGWFIGLSVKDTIAKYDHWVAFILLTGIGLKMIKESFQSDKEKGRNLLNNKILFFLAIATSIDALIVGFTFRFINIPLLVSVAHIGIVTFVLCFVGFLFGKKLAAFLKERLKLLGDSR